jgi:hypothetical protein
MESSGIWLRVGLVKPTFRRNGSVFTRPARRHIPEDGIHHSHRLDRLRLAAVDDVQNTRNGPN